MIIKHNKKFIDWRGHPCVAV